MPPNPVRPHFRWHHALLLVPYCLVQHPATTAQAGSVLAGADTEIVEIREPFSSDPVSRGWERFGDPELFRWNASNQNLDVTWDSSHPNSYLRLPLGTVLTRRDSFSLELDLQLADIEAGVSDLKPGTFQIAFGFQNRGDAESPHFVRGTGDRSPNLVEFNFFPDTGYGPTVWPAVFADNGRMNYSGSGDFSLFELPVNIPLHVQLRYDASTQSARIQVLTNGVELGSATAALSRTFTWFELDTVCISSYSDSGQAPFMPGSILAHGILDNLVTRIPPSPIRSEQIQLVEGHWRQSFLSRQGWHYVLQASADLRAWTDIGPSVEGTGDTLTLEANAAGGSPQRFFRIRANPTR